MHARRRDRPGQTLVETALVLPLFLAVVIGVITFGIGLFYQQQVSNVAREAARYAAVHSASASATSCPTGGWLAPDPGAIPAGAGPWDCDSAAAGWPGLTTHARSLLFGMNPSDLHVAACWEGYVEPNGVVYDAGPYYAGDPTGATENDWVPCTMEASNIDPVGETGSLACPSSTSLAAGNDTASNLAVSDASLAVAANRVVVYACYNWSPPMAGFLGIPETIVLRGVISEALQHQR